MQVYIAEKCRIFVFLFRSVRVFAVIEYVFYLFVIRYRHRFGVDLAVGEVDILRPLQFDAILIANDGHLVKEDIVHRFTFEPLDVHRLFRTDARNIAESDIGPVGEEGILVVAVGGTDSGTFVCVSGGDEESRLENIFHDDVVAVYILAPTSTTGC